MYLFIYFYIYITAHILLQYNNKRLFLHVTISRLLICFTNVYLVIYKIKCYC